MIKASFDCAGNTKGGYLFMSLGENIQFLRKKENITQEQFAERLEVSRQSVSKWESDTAYPEMEKILQMCELFHVSMDDLVRNDVSTLYIEDQAEYETHMNSYSRMITTGVGLILFGLSMMFFLEGMNARFLWFWEEYYDDVLGKSVREGREGIFAFVLLIFVAAAVALFIVAGLRHGNFWEEHPYLPQLYRREEIKAFRNRFTAMIAAGVTIILIDVIIMVGVDSFFPVIDDSAAGENLMAAFFFLLLTVAVSLFVYAGTQSAKYDIDHWNEMHDKTSEVYRKDKLTGMLCGCIMIAATIIYLIGGFCFGAWGIGAAVIYSVGGLLCGITAIVIDHCDLNKGKKESEEEDAAEATDGAEKAKDRIEK